MGMFCEVCEIEFKSEKAFRDHFNLLHVGSVTFTTVGGLLYTFSRSSDGLFRCPVCASLMKSVDYLYAHVECVYKIPSYKRALNEYKKNKQKEKKKHIIQFEELESEAEPETDCEEADFAITMDDELDYNAEKSGLEEHVKTINIKFFIISSHFYGL